MSKLIEFPYESARLDNGMTIVTMPMPSPGLASFWTIVRTGSRDEFEAGRTGFAHFFEHMMFRGTEKYPSDRYQRVLTELGADANAYTTDDLTAYHLAGSAEDLETVFELESDRFMRLDYPERDFRTEAGAVYGEYRKDKTEPLFVLYEAVREAAFEKHTYGHTTLGYESDIAIMPTLYEYSREFFHRYYRPDNAVLFVAGDTTPERIVDLANRYYGGWAPGYETPQVPDEPAQVSEKRVDVTYEGKALPLLWHAYKIGRFDPSDRIRVAADLLVELAFGETSKAYRKLVLRDQSVEFLAAYTNMNRDPSVLDIYCRIKNPEKIAAVESVLDGVASEFRDKPVDDRALADLKSRIRYGFLMGLETPDDVAQSLSRPLALTGRLDELEALYSAYDDISAGDIRDAANEVLSPERRTAGILRGRDG